MSLPSTLTAKLSPGTRVLTVIADARLAGNALWRQITGGCATPADYGAAAEFQFAARPPRSACNADIRRARGAHHPVEAARIDSRQKIQLVIDQFQRRGDTAPADPVRTPATSTFQSSMPPTQLSQPDPKCSSMRTTSGGGAERPVATRQVPRRSSDARATGEPAMAAATVPSNVTFGQPTGSCGTNAVNATCCMRRASAVGVKVMSKKVSAIARGEAGRGRHNRHAPERGSDGLQDIRGALGRVGALCRLRLRGARVPGNTNRGAGASAGNLGQALRHLGLRFPGSR